MLRRRAAPPDMMGAVRLALAAVLPEGVPPDIAEAGRLVAAAVSAYVMHFAAGSEPAYHNQYHQAEATLAMGWLCAEARKLGLLTAGGAALGVIAMAGHDLHHDGSCAPPGVLEARSAALTARLAAQAGLDETARAVLTRVILATDPMRPEAARATDDLLCRLAQEADLFASLTPVLGWRLSADLAREMAAAGYVMSPPVGSFAGRLALLRAQPEATLPARKLGLAAAVAVQQAAFALLGDGDPQAGAARLDAMPQAAACDLFQTTLEQVLA